MTRGTQEPDKALLPPEVGSLKGPSLAKAFSPFSKVAVFKPSKTKAPRGQCRAPAGVLTGARLPPVCAALTRPPNRGSTAGAGPTGSAGPPGVPQPVPVQGSFAASSLESVLPDAADVPAQRVCSGQQEGARTLEALRHSPFLGLVWPFPRPTGSDTWARLLLNARGSGVAAVDATRRGQDSGLERVARGLATLSSRQQRALPRACSVARTKATCASRARCELHAVGMAVRLSPVSAGTSLAAHAAPESVPGRCDAQSCVVRVLRPWASEMQVSLTGAPGTPRRVRKGSTRFRPGSSCHPVLPNLRGTRSLLFPVV